MEESKLKESLELYQTQLQQIHVALASTEDDSMRAELSKLHEDLVNLLSLTEESLASLKKSQLLGELEQQAQGSSSSSSSQDILPPQQTDMDAEFAAWQAAIAEDDSSQGSCSNNVNDTPLDDSTSIPESPSDRDNAPNLEEIVGTKCRAPYKEDWGAVHYCNAIIVSVDPITLESEPSVKVLFSNATQKSMLPCPYFLESKCKFSDDDCRFSHGYSVLVEELREYLESDHSELKLESRCLARYEEDSLWYKATVVEVSEDHTFKVMFDSYNNTETVSVEDILPLDSKEDEDGESRAVSDEEDEEELPVFLWRPSQTNDSFGEWEQHTRGVGSRLMAKMGYVTGQGLGKNGEGRAEPVPIQLLPAGKSLDKIMELKEKAGDRDLYDVMKKQRRKQQQVDRKAAVGYHKVKPETSCVFDFINNKLGGRKGHVKEVLGKYQPQSTQNKHISEKQLQSKSDRDISIQIFKTQEEIKNVERELAKTRQSLIRNDSDKFTSNRVQVKISSLENYLQQLQTSERSLKQHQTGRKEKKKLAVF